MNQRPSLTERRSWLQRAACGFGSLALAGIAAVGQQQKPRVVRRASRIEDDRVATVEGHVRDVDVVVDDDETKSVSRDQIIVLYESITHASLIVTTANETHCV